MLEKIDEATRSRSAFALASALEAHALLAEQLVRKATSDYERKRRRKNLRKRAEEGTRQP